MANLIEHVELYLQPPKEVRKKLRKNCSKSDQEKIENEIGIDKYAILECLYDNTVNVLNLSILTNRNIISDIYQPLTSRGYSILKSKIHTIENDNKPRIN